MEFDEIQSGFLFTMSYTKQKTSLVEEDEEGNVGVNVGVKTLLVFIENNPGTNVLTMEKHFNVTQRTIERWIKILKEENKIEFKGVPKKGGYWAIDNKLL
ncbi:MAG TPA: HTH domain-containing protein [Lutibacter sp.]